MLTVQIYIFTGFSTEARGPPKTLVQPWAGPGPPTQILAGPRAARPTYLGRRGPPWVGFGMHYIKRVLEQCLKLLVQAFNRKDLTRFFEDQLQPALFSSLPSTAEYEAGRARDGLKDTLE